MVLGIVVIICWILAAACNAVMDVLNFKFSTSIFRNMNPKWWDAKKSWRNKYKNGIKDLGPKFPLSTTVLAFTTDAWHFFQFLSNSLVTLPLVLVAQKAEDLHWWQAVILFLALKSLWGMTFEPLYSKYFRKK